MVKEGFTDKWYLSREVRQWVKQSYLKEGDPGRENGKQKDPKARACLQLSKNIRWPQSHSEGEMGMRCKKRDGEGSGIRIIQNLTVQGLLTFTLRWETIRRLWANMWHDLINILKENCGCWAEHTLRNNKGKNDDDKERNCIKKKNRFKGHQEYSQEWWLIMLASLCKPIHGLKKSVYNHYIYKLSKQGRNGPIIFIN